MMILTYRIVEEEKGDHYRLADVFVMPGSGEGFGIVYLEALACGMPVVASKVDASREAALQGELGVMVNPKDRHELHEGIAQALASPQRVPAGLRYFSPENFQARLTKILDAFNTPLLARSRLQCSAVPKRSFRPLA